MALIIADTDVLIDFLAGRGAADTVEELISRGVLRTTAITRFELLSGARTAAQLERIGQLLAAIPTLVPDEAAVTKAAELRRHPDQDGNSPGMADCLIAGIVILNGGTLLTRNHRHYGRIPDLPLA